MDLQGACAATLSPRHFALRAGVSSYQLGLIDEAVRRVQIAKSVEEESPGMPSQLNEALQEVARFCLGGNREQGRAVFDYVRSRLGKISTPAFTDCAS